jgi:predicted acetyltransferase
LAKNVCISFKITDEILDWNNRTFNILFNEGRCLLTDQKADYHVGMSIATLTTLLLGYKTAIQLYRRERIQGDEHSVLRLDDVILHETPYISDYI